MLIPSVRKIHNHNSHKVIGLSYSHKMDGMIPWESTLERDWLLHLEATPSIRAIYGQPQTFDYCADGKWHRYTPDFEVHWRDHDRLPTLYEVKPYEVTIDPEFVAISKAIRASLAEQGYEYLVIDSKTIRDGPHLANLNHLKHYADVFVPQRVRRRLADYLIRWGTCWLIRLAVWLGSKSIGLAELYRLLWEGWLEYNKNDLITSRLDVRHKKGERK